MTERWENIGVGELDEKAAEGTYRVISPNGITTRLFALLGGGWSIWGSTTPISGSVSFWDR